MTLKLREYMYFADRRRGEGLRIGCTRYLVRGVRKKDYAKNNIFDVWLPSLAPSQKLMAWAKRRDLLDDRPSWETFLRRYRSEMSKTDARQAIRTLAKVAKVTPISIGCYCSEKRCHRFELVKMIKSAASGRF